jgi:PDZ domain-containing protein
VTGPSAGLAWTLGLIDRLTPGSLTGGREVAVTGTIAPDGTVGPIGGVAQKMATVKRAGVKLFLFPKQTDPKEAREVRKIAGSDVEVHQVGTLDEALAIIAPHGVPAAPPLS